MLENTLTNVARKEQPICTGWCQGRKEPQLRWREILRFVDDDFIEGLGIQRVRKAGEDVCPGRDAFTSPAQS